MTDEELLEKTTEHWTFTENCKGMGTEKPVYSFYSLLHLYIYRDFVFKIKKAEGMQVYIVLSRFTSLDF